MLLAHEKITHPESVETLSCFPVNSCYNGPITGLYSKGINKYIQINISQSLRKLFLSIYTWGFKKG